MRLLHVVPTYLPAVRYGGPIHSVHGLCAALAARGHDVEVYTTNVDGPEDSAVPLDRPVEMDGVKVWYFPSRRLRRLYWSPPMARKLKREVAGFDLAHLHSVFLWPTWVAARAARRHGVPYVLSPRGMLVEDLVRRKSRWLKRAWIRLIERTNMAHAAAIHVTSEIEAAELAPFAFAMPRVITIPNGLAIAAVSSVEGIGTDIEPILAQPNLVLFLGRIHWKKGLDRLIPAMAAVTGAHLAIVGNDEEGLLPELEALVERHSLRERVTFVPRVVNRTERDGLMSAAKVFALASFSENFGNTVLEAMALGCPVLVTPEVGAANVVRESGGGRVVSGEPAAFGPALQALLDAPDRAEIGERGRRFVTERFGWTTIAQQMEEAYQGLIRPRTSAGAIDR